MAKADFKELGSSGLARYGGYIYEEFLPELRGDRWRKVLRQMSENDATVGALLFAIEMLARQARWDLTAADDSNKAKQEAEFYRQVLFEDLDTSWPDTLSEILTFLKYGWSFTETVYKLRGGDVVDPTRASRFDDGRIGLRKLAARAQDSVDRWEFNDAGEATALVQRSQPDFIERVVPLGKGLHFRTSVRKGNPEGRSILRNAYTAWYYKTNIARIEAIGIERDLAGLPVGKVPAEYFNAAANTAQANIFAEYQKIITSIRRDEQEGVLIPSDRDEHGNALFDLELLSTGGRRQFDTEAIITRYDQRITIVVLADFILLGHTAKSGSYGMSESKSDFFAVALNSYLDSICAEFNRKLIPKLGKMNGIPQPLWPRLTHDGVDQVDLGELGDYVSKLSGAQVSFTPQQQAYLKKQAGIPVTEEEEAGEMEEPEPVEEQSDDDQEPDNTE